jgi:clan AA aspartic protease (TIGR02281 family)
VTTLRLMVALVPACALAIVAYAGAADLNQSGMAAYQRGDFETAERLFRRAISESPREPLFHYHRAAALTQLGRWVEAVPEYESVLRLGPDPALAEAARTGLASVRPLTRPTVARPRDGDETSIPLRRAHGGWIADVVVNDERRARFLVDTGAALTTVSTELARALRIEADPGSPMVKLVTGGGVITVPLTTIPSVSVGGVEATAVRAVIHDIDLELDGILGNSFLDRYQVTVDSARSRLLLRPR